MYTRLRGPSPRPWLNICLCFACCSCLAGRWTSWTCRASAPCLSTTPCSRPAPTRVSGLPGPRGAHPGRQRGEGDCSSPTAAPCSECLGVLWRKIEAYETVSRGGSLPPPPAAHCPASLFQSCCRLAAACCHPADWGALLPGPAVPAQSLLRCCRPATCACTCGSAARGAPWPAAPAPAPPWWRACSRARRSGRARCAAGGAHSQPRMPTACFSRARVHASLYQVAVPGACQEMRARVQVQPLDVVDGGCLWQPRRRTDRSPLWPPLLALTVVTPPLRRWTCPAARCTLSGGRPTTAST